MPAGWGKGLAVKKGVHSRRDAHTHLAQVGVVALLVWNKKGPGAQEEERRWASNP